MFDQQKSCSLAIKIKKKRTVKFKIELNSLKTMTISDQLNKKKLINESKNNYNSSPHPHPQKQNTNTERSQQSLKKYMQNQSQQQIKEVLNDIKSRGETFCKFSIFGAEKQKQSRKVFGEYFNLKPSQMKGTMTVGQLWTNKQKANFLKQNKIYLGKMKLYEKINELKKLSAKKGKRTQSQGASTYQDILQSISQINTTQTIPASLKNSHKNNKSREYSQQFVSVGQTQPTITLTTLSIHKLKKLQLKKKKNFTSMHSKNDLDFFIGYCLLDLLWVCFFE